MKLTRDLLSRSWRSWYAPDLRRVGPPWLQAVWTFAFATTLALGLTAVGMAIQALQGAGWHNWSVGWRWFAANWLTALVIGYIIHGLFLLAALLGGERIRAFSLRQRALFFAGVPMLGVTIGWPLSAWLLADGGPGWGLRFNLDTVLGSLLISLVICFIFYKFFDAKARQVAAEQRATEAQLRVLQAQIEPHFLFNTLANVLSLIDSDAATAKRMLESFIDYLRATLGNLRSDRSTLGNELAMAEAYLLLMQMRMCERLAFRIEVADEGLRDTLVPPLLLQPLVENAIHHGLECKVEGGTVTVSARREGGQLVLEITDDGLGLCDPPVRRAGHTGNGVALANLGQRLASRYGDTASVRLEALAHGARATLRLPLQACAPA